MGSGGTAFLHRNNCQAQRLPSAGLDLVGEHELRQLTRLEAKLDEPGSEWLEQAKRVREKIC
jgi:hypothetical protein